MTPGHERSPAEQAARIAHHHTQLGTTGHEPTPPRSDFDKAMDFWRAKDAYDAQLYVPLLVLGGVLFALLWLASVFGR